MATGTLTMQAIESVLYYRGRVCGICAVFSAISKVAGVEVKTIFHQLGPPGLPCVQRARMPDLRRGHPAGWDRQQLRVCESCERGQTPCTNYFAKTKR